MRPLHLRGAAVPAALLVPGLLLGLGLGLAAPASAGVGSAGSLHSATSRAHGWARVGSSVAMTPQQVLGATSAQARVRVVSMREVGGHPALSVRTATGRPAALAAVAAAQDAPGALSVGVDSRVHADLTPSNDALRSSEWGLDRLGAEDAWATQTGAGVTVAVVDSGIERTHPDLAGQVLAGKDFVVPSGDGGADGEGHGTHVAGIIAAVANNGIGVAGLAPGVKLLPVRVLDDTGSGWSSDTAAGIIWAVDQGAKVINLSLGGAASDSFGQQAVDYAAAHGVVVVAAAGNARGTGNAVNYPAAYTGVLAVAATDRTDATASFSNTGAYVDLAAPGVAITSTYKGAGYAAMSGTSMATPYAAAAAALVAAANPALTPGVVSSVLEQSAIDLAPAGRDDASGYGLINPAGAVCLATGCAGQAPPPPRLDSQATRVTLSPGASRVRYGGTIRGSARLTNANGSALASTTLQVCTRRAPAAAYTCVAHTTDAQGRVRYQLPARARTSVYVAHPTSATTAASTSARAAYVVLARAKLRSTRHSVVATVKPSSRQRVTLYRHARSGWVVVAHHKVDRHGRATFSRLPGARYRVKVASSPMLRGVMSSFVRVG